MRLVSAYHKHPQFQLGELFKVAHSVKHRAVVRILRINAGDSVGRCSYSGHDGLLLIGRGISCASLSGLRAGSVPNMTKVGIRWQCWKAPSKARRQKQLRNTFDSCLVNT